jgi:hypothetical protein
VTVVEGSSKAAALVEIMSAVIAAAAAIDGMTTVAAHAKVVWTWTGIGFESGSSSIP